MADIDYKIDVTNGFEVSFLDTSTPATGNKLLSNRFTITFLTAIKQYLYDNSEIVVDSYGGDAIKYVGQPQSLNNIQSIASSITAAMNKTVESIKASQSTVIDTTEQLASATLIDVSVKDGTIYAVIEIFPVTYSSPNEIYFTVPVIGV